MDHRAIMTCKGKKTAKAERLPARETIEPPERPNQIGMRFEGVGA
jgi:hypothetical protein